MPSRPRFFKIRKTWSFHVVVWQRTATKCTKTYDARAQLLFVSLNLLFGDVPVDVAVVVCLSFPMKMQETGPTVYSPYPRRLECLAFADIITKAAHSPQLF